MKTLFTLLVASSLFATIPRLSTQNIDPSRIVIKLNDGDSLPESSLITSSKNLFGNYYVAYTNNPVELVEIMNKDSRVEQADFNYAASRSNELARQGQVINSSARISSPFNDPYVGRIWSFNSSADHGISVNQSYIDYSSTNTSPVIVAVVDTGVDYNHEDLKDVMWVNENEIPGNGIDDDLNGYIDDIHGIDTLQRSGGVATGDPMDTHNHGTHVSGTIGATQNNGTGIAGIASNVQIMALRTVPNSGDETDIDVAESFLYAAEHGASLINCSFGKRNNEGGMLVNDTMNYIGENHGVLVVTSAGNSTQDIDRTLTYPASFDTDYMIVIASSTNNGSFSYFSNYGKVNVDVAAPGSSIYSTVRNNRYASYSGTSMASPTTTGMAAEILSHRPNMGPIELKQVIMDSVTDKPRMQNKMQTNGVIDMHNAFELIQL